MPIVGRCFAARLYQRAPGFYSRTPFEDASALYARFPDTLTGAEVAATNLRSCGRLQRISLRSHQALCALTTPAHADIAPEARHRSRRFIRTQETVPRRYRPFGPCPLPGFAPELRTGGRVNPSLPILLSPDRLLLEPGSVRLPRGFRRSVSGFC